MKLIKLKEVVEMTTLSKATIYRLMKNGKFPCAIHLGAKAVAWKLSEIIEWIELKASARS
ncbi:MULTISPECIES: helix-turn-helix transcriptional regulator [Aeromonas]|uniref:AlpA family transcriptional regulator n=2 Tax=Bacteria TaxID=2 RepID=A0A5J6X1B3_9GAMM|nr:MULTISPECIES: AlpA family transcriptional regulator [Aeromonas]MCR6741589.1 AlpA family transcriptional regulator [Aeromonas dhakensis]QFI55833.1 AlpA family transcriptional regulator [Aeromonas simiae]QSR74567.1 AlpA family transcriptional regulator [Aeromonas jandaei]